MESNTATSRIPAKPKRATDQEEEPSWPQILLSVRLDEAKLEITTWREWIRALPAEAKDIKIEGIYKNFLTLLLIRMPVSVLLDSLLPRIRRYFKSQGRPQTLKKQLKRRRLRMKGTFSRKGLRHVENLSDDGLKDDFNKSNNSSTTTIAFKNAGIYADSIESHPLSRPITPISCNTESTFQPNVPATKLSMNLSNTLSLTSRGDDDGFRYRELYFMEFRLLKVLPERTAITNCEIVFAFLKDPPPYTAISYAWGDVDDAKKIEIGGDRVEITSSLHGALRAVRNQATVLVWAGAVCINQRNKDERTKQVQLMSKIYERAESVAIWLGPEADGSDTAAELLCDIAANRFSLINLEMILNSADKGACASLIPLFERDYWQRVYVELECYSILPFRFGDCLIVLLQHNLQPPYSSYPPFKVITDYVH